MKVNKHIAVILSICFAVYLGHNLIPHHHHTKAFNTPITNDCPFEHDDHHDQNHDSSELPTHCHAFNDIVFEKYSAPVVKPWIYQLISLVVSHNTMVPDTPVTSSSQFIVSLKLPCKSPASIGTRALRAPPVSA